MPVSPSRARRLAQEREKFLEVIDDAILCQYGKADFVSIEIGQDIYTDSQLTRFITETYDKAGWSVDFDHAPGDEGGYCLVLREKT